MKNIFDEKLFSLKRILRVTKNVRYEKTKQKHCQHLIAYSDYFVIPHSHSIIYLIVNSQLLKHVNIRSSDDTQCCQAGRDEYGRDVTPYKKIIVNQNIFYLYQTKQHYV